MIKHLLLFSFLFISLSVSAQHYYTKFTVGYGIPLGGRELTRAEGDATDYEQKIRGRLSAGKGLHVSFGGGKMFNQYFGFEVNAACAVLGRSVTSVHIPDISYEKLEKYHNYNITPAVKLVIPFALGKSDFWKQSELFSRIGLVVPLVNGGTVEYTQNLSGTDYYKKEKIVNFFDPGFLFTVGLSVPLSEKLLLSMEISCQNLNNKIKSSEVVEYTVNGTDKLFELTTSEKEIKYHRKRVNEDDNLSGLDVDKPTDRLTVITPAHNIAVSVGLIFKL